MPTTYSLADAAVRECLRIARDRWHEDLRRAGVRVAIQMAENPDGDALVRGGYKCLAVVKVLSLTDRLLSGHCGDCDIQDAKLLIDLREWEDRDDAERLAILDHELSHLELVLVPEKQLWRLRAEDPDAPDYKVDDLGRPRLRAKPADWASSDGFVRVVERHGAAAAEYRSLTSATALADGALDRRLASFAADLFAGEAAPPAPEKGVTSTQEPPTREATP